MTCELVDCLVVSRTLSLSSPNACDIFTFHSDALRLTIWHYVSIFQRKNSKPISFQLKIKNLSFAKSFVEKENCNGYANRAYRRAIWMIENEDAHFSLSKHFNSCFKIANLHIEMHTKSKQTILVDFLVGKLIPMQYGYEAELITSLIECNNRFAYADHSKNA